MSAAETSSVIVLAPVKNINTCKVIQSMDRQRVWKVMRVVREYTIEDIARLTEIQPQTIRSFSFFLQRAGYVRQSGCRKNEAGQRKAVFRLVRDTGPLAPEQHCCLVDGNIQLQAVGKRRPSK